MKTPRRSRSRTRAAARAVRVSRQTKQFRRRSPKPRKVGRLFDALVALQARLRAKNGCPWDREQTHASLRTYLVEETYEVLEALDSGKSARLAEELGDLLLQIVFHAEIARERGRFDVGDVIERVHTKMVRRHPHVFGSARAGTAAQVLKNWEQLKAAERLGAERENGDSAHDTKFASLMDGLPKTLPALLEAFQLTRRASRVGFDWEHIDGLFDKLREESEELREALGQKHPGRTEEEVGDLLFVAVNVARFLGVDPEIALKKANRKFAARFRHMERAAAHSGRALSDTSKADLETLWESSKLGAAGARKGLDRRAERARRR